MGNGKPKWKSESNDEYKMFWTGYSWDCFWGGMSPEAPIDTPVPPFEGYTGDRGENDIRVYYVLDVGPSLDEVSKSPVSYVMHVSGHHSHPAFNGRFIFDGHENGKPKWRSESNDEYKMFWTGHSWDCYFGGYSPEAPIDTPVPPLEGYTGDQGECDIRVYYELDEEQEKKTRKEIRTREIEELRRREEEQKKERAEIRKREIEELRRKEEEQKQH